MKRPRGCIWIAIALAAIAIAVIVGLIYFSIVSKGRP